MTGQVVFNLTETQCRAPKLGQAPSFCFTFSHKRLADLFRMLTHRDSADRQVAGRIELVRNLNQLEAGELASFIESATKTNGVPAPIKGSQFLAEAVNVARALLRRKNDSVASKLAVPTSISVPEIVAVPAIVSAASERNKKSLTDLIAGLTKEYQDALAIKDRTKKGSTKFIEAEIALNIAKSVSPEANLVVVEELINKAKVLALRLHNTSNFQLNNLNRLSVKELRKGLQELNTITAELMEFCDSPILIPNQDFSNWMRPYCQDKLGAATNEIQKAIKEKKLSEVNDLRENLLPQIVDSTPGRSLTLGIALLMKMAQLGRTAEISADDVLSPVQSNKLHKILLHSLSAASVPADLKALNPVVLGESSFNTIYSTLRTDFGYQDQSHLMIYLRSIQNSFNAIAMTAALAKRL